MVIVARALLDMITLATHNRELVQKSHLPTPTDLARTVDLPEHVTPRRRLWLYGWVEEGESPAGGGICHDWIRRSCGIRVVIFLRSISVASAEGSLKAQSHWLLAMRAAVKAGRMVANRWARKTAGVCREAEQTTQWRQHTCAVLRCRGRGKAR